MDSNTSLSPMPPAPTIPASPSAGAGPRKRSIHEVDDAATPSPNAKRTLTEYTAENQENRDPSHSDEAAPSVDNFRNMFPRPTVEIVVRKSSSGQNSPQSTSNTELDPPASKKRSATSANKDAKQQEKDAKERQKQEEKVKKEEEKVKREEEKVKREEEKAKREEEKRLKAEEKKKRDAERDEEKKKREAEREEEKKHREEKKKAKEDEKAAKEAAREEEKRKKDEEKEKKARSQMRLNSFFAKPPTVSTPSGQSTVTASPSKPSTLNDTIDETPRDQKSDYEQAFPTFFLKSHTTLAPPHRFERDTGSLEHVRQTVDMCLNAESAVQPQSFRPSEVFNMIPFHRKRGQVTNCVKDILLQLQKDQEDSTHQSSTRPEDLLRKVTMKSLKFGEDIRPPYQGTYTRRVSPSSAKKLSRNPYYRGLPDTDYDYDSEAEWEEPEEGEELDSEEEEEGSDDGEDDLDGFLDDEDDAPADGKRRLIVGDLEPVCSGIQWAADGVGPELEVYQVQTISDAVKFPIDPFSTAYWEKPRPAPIAKANVASSSGPAKLNSFRVPAVPGGPASTALPPNSKAKRPFPPEQLGEFKETVEGNDLTKIGLVEILKKRFPKVSKETLKATIDLVAVRVGDKEADKKWTCR
ncbi:uncharacterized protein N7511_000595 [Penicillium nucicola]|uniref:uncharacterized protein n=1 Tax=Penicillium nucicola TaxID=1850975 RepID=UPI002544E2FF|nr:uncharacterized protein N7511_000595 [Penicillium nucicola]KAJ5775584.1 hypothetical protein N7511_000595 [Penicillium nucicola]